MIVRNVEDEDVKKTFYIAHGGALAWTLLGWDLLRNFEGFWYSILKPGMVSQIHNHPMEEIFFFIQGGATIRVDDEERITRNGDTVLIPSYAIHGLVNKGDKDCIYIVVGSLLKGSKYDFEETRSLK